MPSSWRFVKVWTPNEAHRWRRQSHAVAVSTAGYIVVILTLGMCNDVLNLTEVYLTVSAWTFPQQAAVSLSVLRGHIAALFFISKVSSNDF